MRSIPRHLVLLLALAGLALVPGAVQAQGFQIEGFGGYYFIDQDELDDDVVFGGRFGYDYSDVFGVDFSLSFFDTEADLGNVELEADFVAFDLSAVYHPGGGAFYLLAGPGWAQLDATARGFGQRFSEDDDVFTAHAGLGFEFDLTGSVYLRPDARLRWYDDSDGEVDYEATLALGWRFD